MRRAPFIVEARHNFGREGPRMPELMTLPEAAEYLRLTPSALYTQRHRHELPGALGLKVGRKIVYRRADIDAYLDGRLEAQLADGGQRVAS